MSTRKRVVAWSTGTVGRHAIAGIDARPDLELVGLWVSNPDKVGQDAGRLAGLDRDLGVLATDDNQALYDLAPDAVLHTAMTDDRIFDALEDIIEILEHGINVISSGPVVLTFPERTGLDNYVDRINAAGAATGASLHVNGIDPGFANDVLPLVMTSLSQRIDLVRVSEICDYATYYQPVVMQDLYGFGRPLDFRALLWEPGVLTQAWGPVVRQIAAGLDLELEVRINGTVVARPPYATTYWSPAQMLAHLTVNGASLRTGDVFASGTVSGPEPAQRGSLLELTWNGTEPITLADGTSRGFLEDGDEVSITASAPTPSGGRLGLGEVTGRIRPAR